jgi:hypothetical protein
MVETIGREAETGHERVRHGRRRSGSAQETIAVRALARAGAASRYCLGSIGTRTSEIDALGRKRQSKGKTLVFA